METPRRGVSQREESRPQKNAENAKVAAAYRVASALLMGSECTGIEFKRIEERIMAAYGYSKGVVNENGLHELTEVSFAVGADELRRIAAFLIQSAELAESGEWRSSHRHIDRPWTDCDVIVLNPAPTPPRRVRKD